MFIYILQRIVSKLKLYIDKSWVFPVNEEEFHNYGKKLTT